MRRWCAHTWRRRTGEEVYTAGYEVWTTLGGRLQGTANAVLRQTLLEYDARYGYRGSERHVATGEEARPPEKALADTADVGGLVPAVVTSVDKGKAVAWARDVGSVDIDFESMEWARLYINENNRGAAPGVPARSSRPGTSSGCGLTGTAGASRRSPPWRGRWSRST